MINFYKLPSVFQSTGLMVRVTYKWSVQVVDGCSTGITSVHNINGSSVWWSIYSPCTRINLRLMEGDNE